MVKYASLLLVASLIVGPTLAASVDFGGVQRRELIEAEGSTLSAREEQGLFARSSFSKEPDFFARDIEYLEARSKASRGWKKFTGFFKKIIGFRREEDTELEARMSDDLVERGSPSNDDLYERDEEMDDNLLAREVDEYDELD